jgi:hypothetical protein
MPEVVVRNFGLMNDDVPVEAHNGWLEYPRQTHPLRWRMYCHEKRDEYEGPKLRNHRARVGCRVLQRRHSRRLYFRVRIRYCPWFRVRLEEDVAEFEDH